VIRPLIPPPTRVLAPLLSLRPIRRKIHLAARTADPTSNPSGGPTIVPTTDPTADPTNNPSVDPTIDPTDDPTADPTAEPTADPTERPTTEPTTSDQDALLLTYPVQYIYAALAVIAALICCLFCIICCLMCRRRDRIAKPDDNEGGAPVAITSKSPRSVSAAEKNNVELARRKETAQTVVLEEEKKDDEVIQTNRALQSEGDNVLLAHQHTDLDEDDQKLLEDAWINRNDTDMNDDDKRVLEEAWGVSKKAAGPRVSLKPAFEGYFDTGAQHDHALSVILNENEDSEEIRFEV